MDTELRRAIDVSHLRGLPERTLDGLLTGASRTRIPEGGVFHREGEDPPHLELVVSGLVRVFIRAPDGRTMTVRYCRPGALLGVMSLFAVNFTMPATVQALTDTDLLRLAPDVARRSADTDVRVARALLNEQSERAVAFLSELPGGAFATVREVVVRVLRELRDTGTVRTERDRIVIIDPAALAREQG